jgi:hypothetical protein
LILSYIVKPLPDDGMIIYEVVCQDRQIRVSVHKYQSILKGFPKALVINYNTLTAPKELIERKRHVVKEV